MLESSHLKPTLPMVRLNLVEPLVRELERRKIDFERSLAELSVRSEDIRNTSLFVPAPKMYTIVEKLADVSGDPHFGVHVGERLDPWNWPPMLEASSQSRTVGEFLLRFMESAQRDENSVTFILKTIGNRSTFHERRFTNGGVFPRHNDGFTVAYLLTLIRRSLGDEWEGAKVLARVCDPDAVPAGYLGIRVAASDALGASVSFPASWLIRPVSNRRQGSDFVHELMESPPAYSFTDAFRQGMLPHIHEFDLDVARIARICGLNKRTLARKLQQSGTSAHKEITALRRSKAQTELRNSEKPIAAIAGMVGYSDPTVFSRAFRRWTGMSPRDYRKSVRNNS